jgi:RPA family protein
MKRRNAMKGAARIFAREFQQATLPLQAEGLGEGVLSPFGLPCRLLFVAGVLTELERKGPDLWIGRVADPTGVFAFSTERSDSSSRQVLQDLSPPSFVTLLAKARPGTGKAPAPPSLALLEIAQTERSVRDLWVIRTAERTVERLFVMLDALHSGSGDPAIAAVLSHYRTTESDLKEMAEVVYRALATVSESSVSTVTDEAVRERVLEIIRESAGKSGIPLEDIIEAAGRSGIDRNRAREAVKALVDEDECYQPARGFFKPL